MPAINYYLCAIFLPLLSVEYLHLKKKVTRNKKFTFRKSAKADLRFDSHFARSMASVKLLIKSEYTSSTADLENEATKTSPIFSS